jgi:hypothetical protein
LIGRRDDAGMSIVARRGRVVAEPRSRLLRFERPAAPVVAAGAIGRPAGPASSIDPDDPRHELARLALDLVVRTSEPIQLPSRWLGAAFGREVERTRAQLVPVRSRSVLASSFSREASVAVSRLSPLPGAMPPGPVRVAYAIRWLELGDDRPRPGWSSITKGAAADLAGLAAIATPAADAEPRRIGDPTA